MAEVCIIDSDKIRLGDKLMYNNKDLVEWSSSLKTL